MLFLLIPLIFSQYGEYGKNKIQYQDFSFYYLEGEKFLLYYQEGSEDLANFAYEIAEKTIEEYEEIFNFKLRRKIPIIVYNSPNQFQQTNIILDLLEEGILGFAEMFKNRVVLPFAGSYYEFLYTLRHEIAHIFEYDYYWRRGLSTLLSLTPEFTLPTWFMEGLSEYLSRRRNSLHPIIIADLLINDKFVPLSSLPEGSYLNYVLGEHFFIFLEERYSNKKVYEFLREVKKRKGIDGACKKSFGKSFSSLEKDFLDYLKERYYPLIYKKTNFEKKAKIIIDHQKEKRRYNTFPLPISETEIIYLSYKDNQVSIFSYSFLKEKSKVLLKGVSFLGMGEISILKPAITYSSQEGAIYYVKRLEGKIYLCKYSLRNKREERYYLPLEDAYHLNISPDNKKIVLCGMKQGFSNLYLFLLDKKELISLTSDIYEEKEPYFFNNDTLLFISDREKLGSYGIYLYSLKEKTIKKIYEPKGKELSSVIPISLNSLDTLLFVLDNSLVIYSLKEDKILYLSDFLGACQTPIVYKNKIFFSYYHNQGYSICQIDNFYSLIEEKEFTKEEKEESEFSYPTEKERERKKYNFSLSADYATGQAFFTSTLGFTGSILISLSDLLGNHRFLILTDLYGLIDLSNFYFSYAYLKRREDYYFTLFQFVDFYYWRGDTFLTYTEKGIFPALSYPFTKFLRSDFGLLLYLRDFRFYYQGERIEEIESKRISEKFLYIYSGLVYDNALFSYFGPIKGQRFLLQPYFTIPPSDSIFQSVYLETRNYFNIYNNSYILALLFGGITSFGINRERFYPDGSFVRGYEYVYYPEEEETNPYLIYSKLEFRTPFIEILKLGFPLPITIRNIRGNTFLDFGTNFKKSIFGAGFGLRFFVGYFPFMIDFAYPLSKKEDRSWQITFGIKEDW